MSFEADLRSRLLEDAGLTALVGRRVDWNRRPVATGLPAVTLHRIATGRFHVMRGTADATQVLVQFDCWANSAAGLFALRDAVVEALALIKTPPFTCALIEAERADFDPEQGPSTSEFQRASLDVRITHKPTGG